jgi:Flp pilus assembly protein TadG
MRWLACFAGDRRGVAAVELALIAPIIAGVMLSSYSLWDAGSRRQDLRAALNTGSEYYFNGGRCDSVASQAIQSAWQRRPSDSSINITRSCACGATPLVCSATCPDGSQPATYVQMQLVANDPAAMMDQNVLETRVVRVR